MIRDLKRKNKIDYSAPHNRTMLFRMRLLKFYKQIEYDEDIYVATANKILSGTLPWEYVNKIEKLRLKHEKEKKKGGKNSKRQKPKVLVLKLEPSLISLKDKHYWKVGGTI